MFRDLISCCGLFKRRPRKSKNEKKADKQSRVERSDETSASMKEAYPQEKNPFSGIPLRNDDGSYINPFLADESREELRNPFLKENEEVFLITIEEKVIPLLSSNPFVSDFFGESPTCVINLLDDPILNVTQCPKGFTVQCEEWVEHHKEFYSKPLRSFSL